MKLNADTQKSPMLMLNGVVIGVMMSVSPDGQFMVIFPGNESDRAISAKTTVSLSSEDIGAEVALMFEGGDPTKPIIMGRLLRPDAPTEAEEIEADLPAEPPTIEVDGQPEHTLITGKEQIVLRCGKASITMTRAGKIIIRGAYISSRSSGVNRLKGGSIHLN